MLETIIAIVVVSGIAAALAAGQRVAVQQLEYETLRERLLAQRQVLELPDTSDPPLANGSIVTDSLPGIVLDDAEAELTGEWSRSTRFKPHIGLGYIFSGDTSSTTEGDGRSTAKFRFKARKSGNYQLEITYSAHKSRATNVPVVVTTGRKEWTFIVDQTQPLPSGQIFRSIGNIRLGKGVETSITINNRRTVGFVVVDALRLRLHEE